LDRSVAGGRIARYDTAMTPSIQVDHLCKNYGAVQAVQDVSFQVAPGELVGFLGLNGAGKSTTLKILTTYLPASSGTARIDGFDVMYQAMEVRQRLGYLPESVPIYPEMRVEEYLGMRAKLKGIDRTTRIGRIDYCLEHCRIREVRRRLIGTLSKGYRQRVGLADALLAGPSVLILDEPLSGLDPIQQEETLATIRSLAGQHTVLFSSHQLADVEKICDRVIIIDRGTLRFDDKLTAIAKQAALLVVELRGPTDAVTTFLNQTEGVAEVHAGPMHEGWGEYRIRLQSEADPRESLAKRAIEQGWGVRRLELRREKLEDTFMRVAYQRG
jgi:ABC-2 type transport system ATP-binding protein